GAALPGSPARHPFTLADQSGRSASLDDFRGQVTVLAFLSSACGAACVLTAQQTRGALDELAHPVPLLFVSADPRVDTRARVARFLAQRSLAGRAHYLTGAPATLRAVWRECRTPRRQRRWRVRATPGWSAAAAGRAAGAGWRACRGSARAQGSWGRWRGRSRRSRASARRPTARA